MVDPLQASTCPALLLSVRPIFASAILSGTKLVELRRVRPRSGLGSLVFLYATAPVKAIVGAFLISGMTSAPVSSLWEQQGERAGIDKEEFSRYFEGVSVGHGMIAGASWTFTNPLSLEQLKALRPGFRPPQSFCYLREDNDVEAKLAGALRAFLSIA